MRIACPGCEAQFDVLNKAEGKVVNCPKCMEMVPVKSANTLAGPPWWAVLLVLFVIWVVFLAVSIFTRSVGSVMIVVFAASLTLTGGVMLIVAAFKEGVKHGILTMLVPFYAIYYVITRYRTVWKAFNLSLAGALFFMTASIVIALKPPVSSSRRQSPSLGFVVHDALPGQFVKISPSKMTGDPELDQILADLGGPAANFRIAIEKLKKMPVNPEHQRTVADRLAALSRFPGTSTRAIEALGIWGTPNEVSLLIGLLENDDMIVQSRAIDALGNLRDERAIGPLVKRLVDKTPYGNASDAIKKFGSAAEPQVLPLLKNADVSVKHAAVLLLEVIGTGKSIPDLRAVADSRGLAASSARTAIAAIQARERK